MRTPTWPFIGLLIALSVGPAAAEEHSAALEAHEQVSCTRCHSGTAAREGKVPNSRCVSCHRDPGRSGNPAAPGQAGHRGTDRRCTECHRFHAPERVQTAAGDLDLVGSRRVAPGACASCHAPDADRKRLNPAHLQAALLYQEKGADLADGSASRGCLNCHDRRSGSSWQGATAEAPLTFLTHASHPIGMKVVPGSGPVGNRMRQDLDPRIPLFDGKMECQSCHAITAATKDLLLPFSSPKDLCLGCHELKPASGNADISTGPLARLD